MKKVGVITFCKSENYGAFLQSLALQKTLKKLGYRPSLIDYETPADIARYALINKQSPKAFVKSLILLPINFRKKQVFRHNIAKTFSFSPKSTPFDIAIAGSDQIWNPDLTGDNLDSMFFLDGINAKRKISYAVSVGNEKIIKKHRSALKKHLKIFDAISVREQQAKNAICSYVKKPITVTMDPTLLIEREDWQKVINDIPINKNDYILTYFVEKITNKQNNTLNTISKKIHLKNYGYSRLPREKCLSRYCYFDSPLTFLARIRDAKLVITSSFHGTVFSIIFHKNFYILLPDPKKRSRIDHLLSQLGLENRIIESEQDLDKITLDNIDYTMPDKKLAILRQKSLDWLKHALEES